VIAAPTPIRRGVPENAQLGPTERAAEVLDPPHERSRQRVHEARRVLRALDRYYEQFKRFGDALASSAAPSASFARSRRALPERHGDSVSGAPRRSRQQTKDRIAELFLRGDTQATRQARSGPR